MTAAEQARAPWGQRLKLILIMLLFAGPPVLAYLLWANGWRPDGTVNRGVLVQPPAPMAQAALHDGDGQPLPDSAFAGIWTVLVASAGACEAECQQTLDLARRVRIALNEKATRVQLALVLPEGVPVPGVDPAVVQVLRARPAQAVQWTRGAENLGGPATAVHLVDPQGFRMMAYGMPLDGRGLLKDLQRLLRVSKEDVERAQRSGEDGR